MTRGETHRAARGEDCTAMDFGTPSPAIITKEIAKRTLDVDRQNDTVIRKKKKPDNRERPDWKIYR